MSKPKVLTRLGISDIIVTDKELERLTGYVSVFDDEGNLITDAETYLIGYETEDGVECNEDGSEL